MRKQKIKEYFYGKLHIPILNYSPARIDIKLDHIKFVKAGGYQLSEGMRSITDNTDAIQSNTDYIFIQPTMDLLNTIIGVLLPEDLTGEYNITDDIPTNELINANIAGFIVIVSLNLETNNMTILSPNPGLLPSKYLLVGSIKWVEK